MGLEVVIPLGAFFSALIFAECRECPGTSNFLNTVNIPGFAQCTHVKGNLIINENTIRNFSSSSQIYEDFHLLSNITDIEGYLLIQNLNHTHLTNLRFLRNLRRIRGRQTVQLFGVQDYTLLIQSNPHLVTLNLASLQSVENGGLRISDNPKLCLVDSISLEDLLVNSTLSRIGGLGFFCSGITCHGECEQELGCWGTLADECIRCRGFKFLTTCVNTCNLSISTPNHNKMICLPITSQPTSSTSTLSNSASTTIEHQANSWFSNTTSSSPTITEEGASQASLIYASATIGSVVIVVTGLVMVVLFYKCKKRKSQKLCHNKLEHSTSLAGTPEKYSRKESDRATLVFSSGNVNNSSHAVRRSTVSIASLASSNDQGDTTTPSTKTFGFDCPTPIRNETLSNNHYLPIGSTVNVLQQNSPIEHAQNSSFLPSSAGVDTGYNSNATSRKASLVGSRASSISLRHLSSAAMATGGNVYPTGQHQLHPQHRVSFQKSRGSLTSHHTNTSLGRTPGGKGDISNSSLTADKGENII